MAKSKTASFVTKPKSAKAPKKTPALKKLPGFAEKLEQIATQSEQQAGPSVAVRSGMPVGVAGGPLDLIRSGLRKVGFSPGQILVLIPAIIRLIQEYGPVVQEIIDELRKLFKK